MTEGKVDKDVALLLRLRTNLLGSQMAPPPMEDVERLGDIANRLEGLIGYADYLERENEWYKNRPKNPYIS